MWYGSVQNGPVVSYGAITPIRDTIRSTVAATGNDKIKTALNKPYSCVGDGSVDPPCKVGKQSISRDSYTVDLFKAFNNVRMSSAYAKKGLSTCILLKANLLRLEKSEY